MYSLRKKIDGFIQNICVAEILPLVRLRLLNQIPSITVGDDTDHAFAFCICILGDLVMLRKTVPKGAAETMESISLNELL